MVRAGVTIDVEFKNKREHCEIRRHLLEVIKPPNGVVEGITFCGKGGSR